MCPAAQGDTDSPCLPLRGRWQREALAEGEISHGFLSLSRLRRQPPPRGGLAARHRRADGTSYPKGICSAALHGRTPSPTGGSTHLPHRAARPQASAYPRRRFRLPCSGAKHPSRFQCAHLPFRRQQASSHPLTCHGMVPQASRTALFRTQQNPATFVTGFCVDATYLPRPPPAKYCQQKRA